MLDSLEAPAATAQVPRRRMPAIGASVLSESLLELGELATLLLDLVLLVFQNVDQVTGVGSRDIVQLRSSQASVDLHIAAERNNAPIIIDPQSATASLPGIDTSLIWRLVDPNIDSKISVAVGGCDSSCHATVALNVQAP